MTALDLALKVVSVAILLAFLAAVAAMAVQVWREAGEFRSIEEFDAFQRDLAPPPPPKR